MKHTITVQCPTCGHDMRVQNGRMLKEWRETAGMTQREFGKLVGVSSPYLSDIERNRRACPSDIYSAYDMLRRKRK